MTAPVKPWERAGVVMDHSKAPLTPSVANVTNGMLPAASTEQGIIQGSGRPPVPPRLDSVGVNPAAGSLYGCYTPGSFGGMAGMYSSPYMAGGFGSYSPYNRFGMGYGNNVANSSFVQQAELNAQGAFQSVESVVSAVSSISMMLESTYMALNNSFRAVLGVADQFSRLRVQLSQVAATFAVFRFLRWLYRRFAVLLGLRKAGLPDDAWASAMKQTSVEAQERFPSPDKSSWPLVLFMAITFGGPYLIWRMLKNIAGSASNNTWADGTSDHVVGECKYDFVGERPDELTVTTGQRINLAPADMQPRLRQNDWLLGSSDGVNTGMVPTSYIRILGTRKGKHQSRKTLPKDPLSTESAGSTAPESSGDDNPVS